MRRGATYDRNPVGRLMTRVTTDVDALNDLFTSGVVSVFGDVFTLAGIMIVLLAMDWRLALVTFSVLPLIVVITQWFRRHVARFVPRPSRTWIARINAFLQENITRDGDGAAVRARGAQPRSSSTRINAAPPRRQHRSRSSTTPSSTRPSRSSAALATALIIWYGAAAGCSPAR
ncbi:MAG: ABC transporter transmembrane domain-containing protein [Candidatus Moduliflexus flocculans]|nr:ABC transporter transmembrane domain-containing protein [Candidatus Moduliflexus flocculans]